MFREFATCVVLGAFVAGSAFADDCCSIPDLGGPGVRSSPKGLPANGSGVVLDFPVTGTPTLNSQFGPRQLGSQDRRYDWHRGMDFSLPIGTTIIAPADAVVVHAGTHPGYADTIVQLRHNSSEPYVYTLYLHLDSVLVTAGEPVDAGDPIALSGQGSATYPHLHWEVRNGCLRQECCELTYSWQSYANTAPAAPQLEAAGDLSGLGRIAMFSAGVPKTEVDLVEFGLTWGGDARVANLNEMTSLSPPGLNAELDDPLYFFEKHGRQYAILPERFNSTFPSANYSFLVWGLDGAVSSGTASVADGGGMTASAPVTLDLPPLSLATAVQQTAIEPESAFSIPYTLTNNDTVSHAVTFEGISAQSIDLVVAPSGGTIGPGESLDATVSGELGDWPEGVGDIVLLRVHVATGSFTDLLGATLIDTVNDARIGDEWKLH